MQKNLMIFTDDSHTAENGITTGNWNDLRIPRIVTTARKQKIVSPELIQQAIANNPLETVPRWHFSDTVKASSTFRQSMPELREGFLNMHFCMLVDHGITFATPENEVREKIRILKQTKEHLGIHVSSLADCFIGFQKVFSFLEFIIEKGRFEEKHLTSVHSICAAYAAINDVGRAARIMRLIQKHVEFNHERYIFELPTVLSTSNLAEILLAMPVWFLDVARDEDNVDPQVSQKTRTICDLVGSKNFAWMYQMYNRRDRSIETFKGPDPIPTDYVAFRKIATGMMDIEVIATPYHQIASREWQDPAWVASIDPLALALFENIPFFVTLKRWSGNGLFPLLPDLMADTISHTESHLRSLQKFKGDTYWYKGDNVDGCYLGSGLPGFAIKLVEAFKRGKVFEFLRA